MAMKIQSWKRFTKRKFILLYDLSLSDAKYRKEGDFMGIQKKKKKKRSDKSDDGALIFFKKIKKKGGQKRYSMFPRFVLSPFLVYKCENT